MNTVAPIATRKSTLPATGVLWAVVLFIVYGSLFPFNFIETPLPIGVFLDNHHLFHNAPDIADNFLLFIPLGFAIVYAYPNVKTRVIAAVLSILLLAIGVQLLQLYLPGRTSAMADSFWNMTGLFFGMWICQIFRQAMHGAFNESHKTENKYALLLALIWFSYESFPFVPTLDIGLLRDHVKTAIFPPPFEPMRWLQHGLAASLGSIAIRRAGLLKSANLSAIMACGLALVLEVLVAYGSLRIETLLGMVCGFIVGSSIDRYLTKKNDRYFSIIIFSIALSAYLLTVLTPYRDQAADAGFTWTPFSHLLWQNITKDIPPAAFEALAIGAMFWSAITAGIRLHQPPGRLAAGMVALLIALEGMRVVVFGWHGDTTPLVTALLLSRFALTLLGHPAMPAMTAESVAPGALASSKAGRNTVPHLWMVIYIFCVLAFSAYIISAGLSHQVKPQWLVYWGVGIVCMILALKYPLIGIYAYVVLGYGISSHGPEYDLSLTIRLRDGIALLALLAWAVNRDHAGRKLPLQKLMPIAGMGFFLWLLISAGIAVFNGTPLGPITRFDPSTYIHAAIMLVLAADLLRDKYDHILLAVTIAGTALGRSLLQGLDGVYLESYVATLLVMSIPIGVIVVWLAERRWQRLLALSGVAAMLFFLLATQNRNAAVALVLTGFAAVLQLRLNWLKKVIGLAVAAGLVMLALPTQYYGRFSVLWDGSVQQASSGLDRASAEARLTIWQTAWHIALDYPLVGAGPGNFAYFLNFYAPGQGRLGAHNSYLQALAETGFVGLFFYVALFLSGYLVLRQVSVNPGASWQAKTARLLQLVLVAYLALGLFNNRNDLVLAYIVVGWALALKLSLSTSGHWSAAHPHPAAPPARPVLPATERANGDSPDAARVA